jgi:hypothetical protein
MNELDIAWAAGLFEGEGSVYFSRKRNAAHLAISMTDREPLEKFAQIFELQVEGPFIRGEYLPVWRVGTSSRVKIRIILEKFRSWLSPRRIVQFETSLGRVAPSNVMQGEAYSIDCPFAKPWSQAGYKRHKSRNEPPCKSCIKAHAEYHADLRKKHKNSSNVNLFATDGI